MDGSDRLDRLIAEGEELIPLGGRDVSAGPNRELQNDYVRWRSKCIALLTELGPDAGRLLLEVESDTRGQQFYKASASRVLGVLRSARLLTG